MIIAPLLSFLLVLPATFPVSQIPSAVEPKICSPAPENELPNDRFARKGGRETKVTV